MEIQPINILKELDQVSKLKVSNQDDIDVLMVEVSKRILKTMNIERMSVWLFNFERDAIISIGEYDNRTRQFNKDSTLHKIHFPKYFEAIAENKILIAENIYTNPVTEAFTDVYSKPNGVISLMDIPLRIDGELLGVMCFEKTGIIEKIFTEDEQTFALSISLLFASNIEAKHRKAAQYKLTQALKEKDLLIKEINHRVKNNFAVLISLLRISRDQGNTKDPMVIFEEYEQRIISILKIHELLCQNNAHSTIDLGSYLDELVKEFRCSYPEIKSKIINDKQDGKYLLHSKTAINLGLIITEIFLNSCKHASLVNDFEFFIEIESLNDHSIKLHIGNNGLGFDFETKVKGSSMGLPLIKDLASDLSIPSVFPTQSCAIYEFTLLPHLFFGNLTQ